MSAFVKKGEKGPDKPAKGGDADCTKGPGAVDRGMACCGRDPLWCILFVAHFCAFYYLAIMASANGDYRRLIQGTDFMGNVCGARGQDSIYGQNMEDYPFVYYTLNVTASMKKMADAAVGPPAPDFGGMSDDMAKAMENPGAAMSTLVGGGGDSFPMSIISELGTYFHTVCVKSCTIDTPVIGSGDGSRGTWWGGYPDWDPLQTDAWTTMFKAETAQMPAYSEDDCPYPSIFCVPLDSMVEDVNMGQVGPYCLPTLESAAAIGEAASELAGAAGSVVPDDFAADASAGFSDATGDLVTAWWTFIVMGFVGLVVGVVYLVLMRMIVGPLVWISLISVAVMLLAGAGLLFIKSTQCKGQSIEDAAVDAANDAKDAAIEAASDALANLTDLAANVTAPEVNVDLDETCPDGYAIESETGRTACLYGSYFVGVLALIYIICLLCNMKRINLAIALNKVAAKFVANQPGVLIVPPIQILVVFAYLCIWCILTTMIVSYVPPGFDPEGTYTYRDAYGLEAPDALSSGEAGTCFNTGNYGVLVNGAGTDDINAAMWSHELMEDGQPGYNCIRSAYLGGTDWRFWYAVLSLLWINAFMVAFGQCSIAGAVGGWYFADKDAKWKSSFVGVGVKTTLMHHLGSVAFGSLIIAIIQLLKYYVLYMAKQAEKAHNQILKNILLVLAYCIWCFEKCAKFLSKNAYIQIALLGKSFCGAAMDAFWLIFRNCGRIAAAGLISPVINLFGFITIMVGNTFLGYILVTNAFPTELSSPYGCMFIYAVEGYLCGKLVMNVFGIAVDTVLQCFVAEEELGGQSENTPQELKAFLAENKEALDKMAPQEESGGDAGAQQ
jgi:hypothetical protein